VTSLQVAVAEGIGELRLAEAEDRFLANPIKRGHGFSVARIPGQ
jgi:hypothetical protein